MKRNVLSIEINAPIETVFEFTRNPKNTSKWVPNIVEETLNTPTTTIGSIYRQMWNNKDDSYMVVTGLIPSQQLDFHAVNGTYTCMYRYEKIENGTKLTYSEENGADGELEEPFTMEIMKKLKSLIETKE